MSLQWEWAPGEYGVQMSVDAFTFWRRKIGWVRLRINVGWVLDRLLPLLFLGAIGFTIAVLAGRRVGWSDRALATGGVLSACALVVLSLAQARRRFISTAQARAQVDSTLRLHNRLASAAEGIGPWPETAMWKGALWRWNARRLSIVPATCAALICGAFLVEIPLARPPLPPPTAKPPALAKAEAWIDKLEKSPDVDPSSLEQMKEEAEQLGRQSAEEWYSHAGLEAADHLKNQLSSGIKALEQNATKVESLLSAATGDATMTEGQAGELKEELSGALSALEGNVPALDKELMGKLGKLDPSRLRDISPQQMKELKQRLEHAKQAAEDAMGSKEGGSDEDEESEGEPGGRGGLSPGPGASKLSFEDHPANLSTSATKAVENPDMSHAALGQTVGVSAGQHDVDKTAENRAQSGGNGSQGAGAGTVWTQQNLTPQEQRQLQQFFK